MLPVLMGSSTEKIRSLFSRTGELPHPRRRVMKTKSISSRSDPLDVLIFRLRRDATRRAVSLFCAIKECAMPSHLAGHFPPQHELFSTHERTPHHEKQRKHLNHDRSTLSYVRVQDAHRIQTCTRKSASSCRTANRTQVDSADKCTPYECVIESKRVGPWQAAWLTRTATSV
jgi:hypothetical protein